MAGRETGRWEKFPNFIEYANDCTAFQHKTEDTLQRAWVLAFNVFLNPGKLTPRCRTGNLPPMIAISLNLAGPDGKVWTNDIVWEVLAINQCEFRMFLNGMISGFVPLIHLKWLDQHANHLWMHPYWANIGPGELQKLLLSCFPNPGFQYYELIRIHDPLDGLYWQLREFLRLGGEQRLRKCPVCERFFVQSTARPATYCGRKCRLSSDPDRRKANAAYQRRSRKKQREKRIDAELERIQEVKARLRAEGEEKLGLEWVLYEAEIDEKRWNYLCRSEEKEHGRRRITDLTRP